VEDSAEKSWGCLPRKPQNDAPPGRATRQAAGETTSMSFFTCLSDAMLFGKARSRRTYSSAHANIANLADSWNEANADQLNQSMDTIRSHPASPANLLEKSGYGSVQNLKITFVLRQARGNIDSD
jgi:hypothetical protein